MRVAIINLIGGGMSGGYQKYLLNLLPRMTAHPEVVALLCISPQSLHLKNLFQPLPNVEFAHCKPFGLVRYALDSRLRQLLESFSPDVIFFPLERSFRTCDIPTVNIIQNMEPFIGGIKGNPLVEKVRQFIQHIVGKEAMRRADRVIALSKFVRDFLVERCNVPYDKIGLVYYGIDVIKNDDNQKPHAVPESWAGRFLFTAGSIRPARGLEDILSALKKLTSEGANLIRLVIAGNSISKMSGYRKKLRNWIQMHNLSAQVCWAGHLNEREMAWCYQNCRLFVMTSRVETFGMIAGEAMAHGCVSIAADNACLPEIFGDAAVYYPPKNSRALADIIQRVLAWNENRRNVASELAKKRAVQFSWDVCAEKTVAELAKVAIKS